LYPQTNNFRKHVYTNYNKIRQDLSNID
jgi:hypothetical protein